MTVLLKIMLLVGGFLAILFTTPAPITTPRITETTKSTSPAVTEPTEQEKRVDEVPNIKGDTRSTPDPEEKNAETEPKKITAPNIPLSKKESPAPAARTTPTSTVETATPPQTQTVTTTAPAWNAINESARRAAVNIICTTEGGGLFRPISGSGVIIHPRGIVLTNAHIAEYLLLKDYPRLNFVDCIIRTGSPATPSYRASLLYLSPSWVNENFTNITEEIPRETGENDYALLRITARTNGSPLPDSFPSIEPDTNPLAVEEGSGVLIAGYPAGFLGGIAIQRDLYLASTFASIEKLYTFGENTVDIFNVKGSIAAQAGVSGGAVVAETGKLVGIIVTASAEENTIERNLRAITLSHVARAFLSEAGFPLSQLGESDLDRLETQFGNDIAPLLRKALTDEIEHPTSQKK